MDASKPITELKDEILFLMKYAVPEERPCWKNMTRISLP
jgi:hypothetical protein